MLAFAAVGRAAQTERPILLSKGLINGEEKRMGYGRAGGSRNWA
jgi:hypothetical protein